MLQSYRHQQSNCYIMLIKIKKLLLRNLFFIKPIRFFLYNYKNFKKLKIFDNLNLNSDSLFIDLGANEGIVSQYILDKYKCNIIAYEPHPACSTILKQKFKNNKKIKLFFGAVSDSSGDKKLYFHRENLSSGDLDFSQASSLDPKKGNINKGSFVITKCYDIKEILNNLNIIDCLKIDIEGYEYKILPEIIKNQKKIKKVFCELHGKPGTKKNEHLNSEYSNLISELKNQNLYGSWFIEHY